MFGLARLATELLTCRTMSNRAAATYYYFSYWTTSGSYRRARTK
jgi:hypothetical protein